MHYAVGESRAYERWRERKLAAYPLDQASLWVAIGDPGRLARHERRDLGARCSAFNLAFYTGNRGQDVARGDIAALGQTLSASHAEPKESVAEAIRSLGTIEVAQ